MNYDRLKTFSMISALLVSMPVFADHPAMPPGHPSPAANPAKRIYGKVVTTMDVNNYTYVQIDSGEQKYWAAGPKTALQKGAMLAIDTQMPFTDFESKALHRKFKTIYFVNYFITDQPGQTAPAASPMDPHAGLAKAGGHVAIKGIKKAAHGKTVAEVFKEKRQLAGKTVRVRGKVMKYTPKVMGQNWLHIQDSSSTKQLVVSTQQDAKIGDQVLVNGVVAVDRNLGYGYTYEIIVEHASVSVE